MDVDRVEVEGDGGMMSTANAHRAYLLGSSTRDTGPSLRETFSFLSPSSSTSSRGCSSNALGIQQRHIHKRYTLERCVVSRLRVAHQKRFRIGEDRSSVHTSEATSSRKINQIEKSHHIRTLRLPAAEDGVKKAYSARDGARGKCVSVLRYQRERGYGGR